MAIAAFDLDQIVTLGLLALFGFGFTGFVVAVRRALRVQTTVLTIVRQSCEASPGHDLVSLATSSHARPRHSRRGASWPSIRRMPVQIA